MRNQNKRTRHCKTMLIICILNISNGKSAMFVGCGYKDELEYK